ncbi:conserved Plasmodium protein, unknown function [Plasmodium ovale]|uniref:Uncharacterized protein n=1 Tax=Plasmodium ovale TaxID=36330 RepID=A0A1D3KX34_PLAOA|nr:conserved Plasmodium protein, unknown function [Plasmodium ovale]
MELKPCALLFYLFFAYFVEAYVFKKDVGPLVCRKWPHGKKWVKLGLKINDIINFKNREELQKEVVMHSKRLALNLNDEQVKNIRNNLYEFFSYMKLMDIKIVKVAKRGKRNVKWLPLNGTDKKYKEFCTQNMKKEGDYFVTSSNSFS